MRPDWELTEQVDTLTTVEPPINQRRRNLQRGRLGIPMGRIDVQRVRSRRRSSDALLRQQTIDADAFARRAHKRQYFSYGIPYIIHVETAAHKGMAFLHETLAKLDTSSTSKPDDDNYRQQLTSELPFLLKQTLWLHDVIEDVHGRTTALMGLVDTRAALAVRVCTNRKPNRGRASREEAQRLADLRGSPETHDDKELRRAWYRLGFATPRLNLPGKFPRDARHAAQLAGKAARHAGGWEILGDEIAIIAGFAKYGDLSAHLGLTGITDQELANRDAQDLFFGEGECKGDWEKSVDWQQRAFGKRQEKYLTDTETLASEYRLRAVGLRNMARSGQQRLRRSTDYSGWSAARIETRAKLFDSLADGFAGLHARFIERSRDEISTSLC